MSKRYKPDPVRAKASQEEAEKILAFIRWKLRGIEPSKEMKAKMGLEKY